MIAPQIDPDFDFALNYLVTQDEKGYWNDPVGGPTNFGITAPMLAKFRGVESCSEADMKALQMPEVSGFYKKMFWDPMKLSELHRISATAVFDEAVNMGQGATTVCVHLAVGLPNEGIFGDQTRAKIKLLAPELFIPKFVSAIQDRYCDLVEENPQKYLSDLKGWIRRSMRLLNLVNMG